VHVEIGKVQKERKSGKIRYKETKSNRGE